MKTITAYETKDGRLFKSIENAEDHEYLLSLLSEKKSDLSKREAEIYNFLVSTDLPNVDIADKLGISQSCIKKHCKSIYDKCNASDRISLIVGELNSLKEIER